MNTISEIVVTDLSHDGRGVGRTAQTGQSSSNRLGSGLSKKHSKSSKGKACFIEGALPNETVIWEKTNSKRSFDEGILVEIIARSQDRVEPRCQYYEQCGGCQLQHMDSIAQLNWKQEQLVRMLDREGLRPKSWLPALKTDQWNYRRRTRLAVQFVKDGSIKIGYRKKQSKHIVPIARCEILDESLNAVIPLLQPIAQLLKKNGLTEFELTRADSAIAICVSLGRLTSPDLSRRLLEEVNNFKTSDELQLWQKSLKEGARPISDLSPLYATLTDKTKMSFVPGQFLQVNGSMNQAMISQALRLALPDKGLENKKIRVLDLFCGAGNFSLAFAENCGHVLGVEGSSGLCQQAAMNAKELDYDNAEFQVADLDKPEQFKHLKPKKIDLVILDPPRSGALKLIPWVLDLCAEKILYISCHPATMVRDVCLLRENYHIDFIGVMDMFPHTAHLEAMLLLTKKPVLTGKQAEESA